MNKIIFLILLFMFGQTSFAQTIPTYTKPKEVPPKPAPSQTKPVPLKTKIIYVEKPAAKENPVKNESIEPEMVFVEGGSFNMGSNELENAGPIHNVTVSSFKIGKYEVTVAQYKEYCKSTGTAMPLTWGTEHVYPMMNVSYDDANGYCSWLSEKTGKNYRLPTEAEWEFAARGGKQSNFYSYSGSDDIDTVAWYSENSERERHPVGVKRSNELGIYDMSGNVWEWCNDRYVSYYSDSPSNNPKGPLLEGLTLRVYRGGSFRYPAAFSRVVFRNSFITSYKDNDLGFRVVLSP